MEAVIATAAYGSAYLAAAAGTNALSGMLLLCAALLLYVLYQRRSGMILDPAALFSLAWLGGCGLSALKLSRLQTAWLPRTWLCFYLIFMGFSLGAALCGRLLRAGAGKRKRGNVKNADGATEKQRTLSGKAGEGEGTGALVSLRLRRAAYGLTAASLLAFLLEALLLGYVPLFTVNTPHAYSYFHISGVHYVTVSCVLVPSLVWLALTAEKAAGGRAEERKTGEGEIGGGGTKAGLEWMRRRAGLCLCFGLGFLIPLLCVSRFQLIFAAALLVFTILLQSNPEPRYFLQRKRLLFLLGAAVLLLLAYLFLSVARAHSVAYLNGIFEMRNPDTPIWFTQPYMYVANNFDNFNCLVRDLPEHTYGLRMLFPLFALTGLKFLAPSLVSFPLYVTKTELTTVTLFYDAYYDFGVTGVFLFAFLLGGCMALLVWFLQRLYRERQEERRVNPILFLIAAQLCFYCLFAFFTTWYSNPSTWFYLAVSLALYCYAGRRRKSCCTI